MTYLQNYLFILTKFYRLKSNFKINFWGFLAHSKIKEDLVEASADANFAAKLNKAAFDAGITLTSLTSIRPTLEETFFEMTVNWWLML